MKRVYSMVPEPRYVEYARALIPDGTADGNPDVLIPAPLTIGAGHDSVVLKATPNAEDPTVDRTNVVTGDFSAVLGSRNYVNSPESFAVGGKNNIYRSAEDGFVFGYNNILGEDSENANTNNSAVGGSGNTLKARYSFVAGSGNNGDNGHSIAIFGNGNTVYNGRGNFVAGRGNMVGVSGGSYNADGQSYNAVFGQNNETKGKQCIIAGTNNKSASDGGTTYDVTALFGTHLRASAYGQTTVGKYNADNTEATFVVGNGDGDASRKNCFAAGIHYDNGTYDEAIWLGNTILTETKLQALLALIN